MASVDPYREKVAPFVDAELLKVRVAELAAQIDEELAGRRVVLAIILKSGFVFAADLMRSLRMPVRVVFLSRRPDNNRFCISLPDRELIRGRDVVVVDAMVDAGVSLSQVLKKINSYKPKTLCVATLFHRTVTDALDLPIRFVGFEVPSVRLVGYGLDEEQRLRGLPAVYTWRAQTDVGDTMKE